METHPEPDDPQRARDGLTLCMKCGKGGNLQALKKHLGLTIAGVESRKDWSGTERKIDPLPDVEACHQALLADVDALDYLMNGRGFSRAIIEQQKLGLLDKHFFRETGEVKALVYPYLVQGNAVFMHYRTLPTMPLGQNKVPKAFSSPKGWDAPLYNGEILRDGLNEVIMVEGEANCISAMDHGVSAICGVPGANFKKAEWIDTLDKLNLDKIYICYDKDKVGQRAAQTLAAKIGIEKCWKITLPDFTVTTDEGITRPGKDLNEYFTQGGGTAESFELLKAEAVLFDVEGVSSSKDACQEFLDELEGREGLVPKYKTPWPSVNKLVGFEDGDVIDFIGEAKQGKCLSINNLILTSENGWVRNGDLKVGDRLASIDGAESIVTGVYPQGPKEMFRITFADGRSTKASLDHLWKIRSTRNDNGWHVYTTDAILNEYKFNRQGNNDIRNALYIPLISGEFGKDVGLPFDPWMLGVLIGDGSFTGSTPRLSSTDEHIPRTFSELLDTYGLQINAIGEYRKKWANGHVAAGSKTVKEFSISKIEDSNSKQSNPLTDILKDLELHGHTAESKFVPKIYLESSRESRLRLLQGLMDTDGTASNRFGTCSYTTISEQLAKDVQYLVRSLGGMAKIGKPTKKKFRYKGELKEGQPAYLVNIRFPERENLFSLQRKLDRVTPRVKQTRLLITHIEPCGFEEAQCISVSHPSKLYITDDFIVTHNTTTAMNLGEFIADTYGDDVLFCCLEMTRPRMARKWISHKAQIADIIPQTPMEAVALANAFRAAIPMVQRQVANREGEFYFCYPRYKTVEDIYTLFRDCIRRYGIKWIVLDNIQRLADTTPRSAGRNRTEHLSEISKVLTQICKDYNVQMIRIVQPNKMGETDGSSQIDKDCDCKITIYRSRNSTDTQSRDNFNRGSTVMTDAAFSPKMLLTVGLSRYSSGGEAELHFEGATSTVCEPEDAVRMQIQAMVNNEEANRPEEPPQRMIRDEDNVSI